MASNPNDDTDKAVALVALLKACAKQKDLHGGCTVHSEVVKRGLLGTNDFINSAIVSMYSKCGALERAQEVFDELPVWTVISWNTLIAGYAQHGHVDKALHCLKRMQLGCLSPSAITFACILKACGSIGASDKGQALHAQVTREHMLENSPMVANGLIDMYAKCGELEKAQHVFDELLVQDVVSWNVLIAGHVQHERGTEAVEYLRRMQHQGFLLDANTFSCVLKACGSIGALEKGKEVHVCVLIEGLLEDVHVATALVDMYARCGAVEKAQAVFDELQVQDLVLWNALIAGYAQNEHNKEALTLFEKMQSGGFYPSAITYACILKACGSIGALDKGRRVHAQILGECPSNINSIVASALVSLYAKCGALGNAREIFEELPFRSIAMWNVMISGYAQNGHGEEALGCFREMRDEGFLPDAVTFSCVLKACCSIGAVNEGHRLHRDVLVHGLLEKSMVVGSGLVEMYASCGVLVEAHDLFERLSVRDVVVWNLLIVGYAQVGEGELVFNLVNLMIQEGTKPDAITLTTVLSACSHMFILDTSQTCFETLSKTYGIIPTMELHACMVDLFGHVGLFDHAVQVIKDMRLSSNLELWHNILGACRKWGNLDLGRWAFKQAVQLDEQAAGAYLMCKM